MATILINYFTCVEGNRHISCKPVANYTKTIRNTLCIFNTHRPTNRVSKRCENLQGVGKAGWRAPYDHIYTSVFCDSNQIDENTCKGDAIDVSK